LYLTVPYFFLDYEKIREGTSDEPGDGDIYYKEPNLSGDIEGENYGIVFGAEDKDVDGEA
jgi:hypothetical protein